MSRLLTHAISVALIGGGACVWAVSGRPLVADPDLNGPVNPLGINHSPYGEVFAMAMQGPIDTYFHAATHGPDHDHDHPHDHEEGEECEVCKHHAEEEAAAAGKPTATSEAGFEKFLTTLAKTAEIRTNPKAASKTHRFYLRRQVEDKLRFAYQLDPAHYGNYNALHLFLTEPTLGTRPQLTPSAAKLAEETIQYCLHQVNDPRPALTAAAAATNILNLMFNDQDSPAPQFTPAQMRQWLAVLDHSLARYATLAKHWEETENWQLLSPERIAECEERYYFIGKIRDAAEKTIVRLEGKIKAS